MSLKYGMHHTWTTVMPIIYHLAWIASSRASTPPYVIIEKLTKHSVKPVEEAIDAAKPDLMVIDQPEQGLAYD
jgi:hypothetical protein